MIGGASIAPADNGLVGDGAASDVAPKEARRESVVGERESCEWCEDEVVERVELDRGREERGAATGSPLEER